MRGLALVVVLFIAWFQPADADEWTQFKLSDTWSGDYGIAAKVSGIVDDRHGTRTAALVVSCVNNRTSVFMSADYLVFGGDIVRVEYVVDAGPRQHTYWNVCAGDLCTGLWNGVGIPFVRTLLDGSVLKMTLTRHFGGPIYATFPVHGAREALMEVSRQCNWKQP